MKFRTIQYLPGLKLAYISNAKAACSTIKQSLWMADSPETFKNRIHNRKFSPFLISFPDSERSEITTFSVVRDPIRRFIYAFADKCHHGFPDHKAWKRIADYLDLPVDQAPDINVFAQRLGRGDAKKNDQHFVPQHVNLMADRLEIDHIFKLEEIDACKDFLAERGVAWQVRDTHKTDPSDLPDLTAESIEALTAYYARDFELYGYELPKAAVSA